MGVFSLCVFSVAYYLMAWFKHALGKGLCRNLSQCEQLIIFYAYHLVLFSASAEGCHHCDRVSAQNGCGCPVPDLKSDFWCQGEAVWTSSLRSEDLNSNVPFFEGLDGVIGSPVMIMSNLMNQIANMGGQEILHQTMDYPQHSHIGVAYPINMLLDDPSAPTWFVNSVMLFNHWCHLCLVWQQFSTSWPTIQISFSQGLIIFTFNSDNNFQAKDESHVKLSGRVPQMVGTGQIKLGKLIMRPDGDFTWHNCSLDSLLYSTFLCNFTHTDPSSISLRGSSLIF